MATVSVRVIEVLMEQSGENNGLEWIRGGFVGSVLEDEKRSLAFSTFGRKRTTIASSLRIGEVVVVDYQPESRKFMDKWYTELRLTGIRVASVVVNPKNDLE